VIRITRIGSGEQLYVNCDHIEWLESTPDTNIVLQSGKRIICVESPADIISRVIDFRRRIAMPPST
jgi:flagellar protein FlbD